MPDTLEEARKYFYGSTYGAKNLKSNFIEGRCIKSVITYTGRWPHSNQCARKATVDGCWCKQHSPAFIEEKNKARQLQWSAELRRDKINWFYQSNGREFYETLKQIADGHNDARALAIETLKKVGEVPK